MITLSKLLGGRQAMALAAAWLAAASLSAIPGPVKIDSAAVLEESPYRYTGYLRINYADGGRGFASASVVDEGVIVTAAHVVFDSDTLSWATGLRMWPRHHQFYDAQRFQHETFFFGIILKEETYRDRVSGDRDRGMDPGVSSWDTFNMDIAVAARAVSLDPRAMVEGNVYPVVGVDAERPESWLREPFPKKIVGYPSDREAISASDRGFMHEIGPQKFTFYWDGRTDDLLSHRDSGGFWNALYYSEDFRVYSGNSGGPVFVWDPDFDRWVNAAIIVGGSETITLVRAIDEKVWGLIEQGALLSGVQRLRRVDDLSVASSPDGSAVELRWTDLSEQSTEVAVLRQAGLFWEEIARVAPAANAFVDRDVVPGGRYVYAVQPISALGNRAPRSDFARVSTVGANLVLGAAVDAPLLAWVTDGEVGFVPYAEGVRSGRVPSLGASALTTSVTGPGDLSFRWSVSSERNLKLPQSGTVVPSSSLKLYDSFYFSVNGEVRRWISGEVNGDVFTLRLPEGTHTLTWEYRKDPYADEFADAGFLHSVDWREREGSIFTGAYEVDTRLMWAHWWGFYRETDHGWIHHDEFGWLYPVAAGDGFWCYSPLNGIGWFYTSGGLFPLVHTDGRGWLYYVRGSGRDGASLEAFQLSSGEKIPLGGR